VLELVVLDQMYAELLLPSSLVRNVHIAQSIPVVVEGEWLGRVGELKGQVTYINPTIDAASRTFKVKVGIPSSDGLVRPGMLVEVRFGP
jgi:multidrug efflux pump subunit AcrA (membrane-fusion protein)